MILYQEKQGLFFMTNIIISIDGPSAAGKGSLAASLARVFDLSYLDTGKMYRALALAIIDQGQSGDDSAKVLQIARAFSLESMIRNMRRDKELRMEEVGNCASKISVIPAVRQLFTQSQRDYAATPPALADGRPARGAILDGRDIGTVIIPSAPLKIFLTASTETRAQRRYKDMVKAGSSRSFEQILADIKERDARDSTRDAAPLLPATDAVVIDSTAMTLADVVEQATALVRSRFHL
jgi:cytidylate kinase